MDYDPPTPSERILARKRLIRWIVIGAVVLFGIYYLVFVNQYTVAYKDDTEHFKHGSIGSEVANGIPYWVFRALPVIYKEDLGPGGYRKFGLLYDPPDADLPLGFSRRIVDGVERVWLNCSVCHIGTYRLSATDPTKYIYGAPSNNLRLQELIKFLLKVGADPGFQRGHPHCCDQQPGSRRAFEFFRRGDLPLHYIFARPERAVGSRTAIELHQSSARLGAGTRRYVQPL